MLIVDGHSNCRNILRFGFLLCAFIFLRDLRIKRRIETTYAHVGNNVIKLLRHRDKAKSNAIETTNQSHVLSKHADDTTQEEITTLDNVKFAIETSNHLLSKYADDTTQEEITTLDNVKFILGFSTGHSGSTSIDEGLRKANCGWHITGEFELSTWNERHGIVDNTDDCRLTDDEVLPLLYREVNAKAKKRNDQNATIAYVDLGHWHNRFHTLECLADRLGELINFVRIRRNRYAIAKSFVEGNKRKSSFTPCMTKMKGYKKPSVATCPRSDEGIGAVNLPVSDEIWDSMSPFQRFLWYSDEIEHRWHTMTLKYSNPSYFEITWSDPEELQDEFVNLLSELGCDVSKELTQEKQHVLHTAKSWNCSDFILQDMEYRHMMKYNTETMNVLVSAKYPQHVDMYGCIETKAELERAIGLALALYQNETVSEDFLATWVFT